jgi:hypothetical protein
MHICAHGESALCRRHSAACDDNSSFGFSRADTAPARGVRRRVNDRECVPRCRQSGGEAHGLAIGSGEKRSVSRQSVSPEYEQRQSRAPAAVENPQAASARATPSARPKSQPRPRIEQRGSFPKASRSEYTRYVRQRPRPPTDPRSWAVARGAARPTRAVRGAQCPRRPRGSACARQRPRADDDVSIQYSTGAQVQGRRRTRSRRACTSAVTSALGCVDAGTRRRLSAVAGKSASARAAVRPRPAPAAGECRTMRRRFGVLTRAHVTP